MKNIVKISCMVFFLVNFSGCICCRSVPIGQIGVPEQFQAVALDVPAPSQDEADVIVSTHIKKAAYLLSPRTSEMPYAFTLLINGQEVKEDVKGVEEVESDMKTEEGKGVHYILKKRFRLKPGRHEITLKTEERSSAKVKVELSGGRIHTLNFEPVYGRKRGLFGGFAQGFLYYEIFLDGNRVQK